MPRWYCREGHVTVSLLPDFAASRLSAALVEVETVVAEVEAVGSIQRAAARLRSDIELAGAVRWTRRRAKAVRALLRTVVGLFPDALAGVGLTIQAFRVALGVDAVLPALRERAAKHLVHLPPPVGFGPRGGPTSQVGKPAQHEAGPDPPARAT